MKKLGIDRLGPEERLALLEEIWDSLEASEPANPLSGAQQVELQKRIAEDDENPDGVISWEDVKRKYPPTGGK